MNNISQKQKTVNLPIRIVFFGTPEFAIPTLKKLINLPTYKLVTVITAPDKPVGRKKIITPPPVKVWAQEHNIPVLQPEDLKSEIFLPTGDLPQGENLKSLNPDLFVVAAYGKILSKEVLDIPKYGCLNIHPSLLPRWRGPAPIQFAIWNGDKKTGATIMLMDEKMDHGPIVATSELEISELDNYEILSKKLAEMGASLLVETIPKWIKSEIEPRPQDESKATYSRILRREDGKIDWQKSAEEIARLIKALNPEPGVYTKYQIPPYGRSTEGRQNTKYKILKILKAKPNYRLQTTDYSVGEIFIVDNKNLAVKCGEGALILEIVQPEGKKSMPAEDFLRGHPELIGTQLN